MRSISDSRGTVSLMGGGIRLGFPNSPHRRTFTISTFGCLRGVRGGCRLVVLSPPTFTGRRDTRRGTLRNCQQLGTLTLGRVGPNKVLFAFSYSRTVSGRRFHLTIFSTTTRASHSMHVLRRLARPVSRPVGVCRPRNRCLGKLILCIRWGGYFAASGGVRCGAERTAPGRRVGLFCGAGRILGGRGGASFIRGSVTSSRGDDGFTAYFS